MLRLGFPELTFLQLSRTTALRVDRAMCPFSSGSFVAVPIRHWIELILGNAPLAGYRNLDYVRRALRHLVFHSVLLAHNAVRASLCPSYVSLCCDRFSQRFLQTYDADSLLNSQRTLVFRDRAITYRSSIDGCSAFLRAQTFHHQPTEIRPPQHHRCSFCNPTRLLPRRDTQGVYRSSNYFFPLFSKLTICWR